MIAKQQQARTRFYYIRQALKQLDRPGQTPQIRVAVMANTLAAQDGVKYTITTDNVSCFCNRLRKQTGSRDLTAAVIDRWEKKHPHANDYKSRQETSQSLSQKAEEILPQLKGRQEKEEDQVRIEELREVRGLVKKFGSNKLRTLIALLEELSQ